MSAGDDTHYGLSTHHWKLWVCDDCDSTIGPWVDDPAPEYHEEYAEPFRIIVPAGGEPHLCPRCGSYLGLHEMADVYPTATKPSESPFGGDQR